jgi:uncharacterized protein (TIGR03435 family)
MLRLLTLAIVGALVTLAQATQAPRPEFDAASVKAVPEEMGWPPRAGYWVSPRIVDPQRFRALTYLAQVIEGAYGVRNFQVSGGPAWIKEAQVRFEIQATAVRPSSQDEMRQMLQTLLADRFKLRLHREKRDFPIYALVVGRNGPKLTAANESSNKDSARNAGKGSIDIGNGVFKGGGATMELLIQILTDNLERPVIDKTSLTSITISVSTTTRPRCPTGGLALPYSCLFRNSVSDLSHKRHRSTCS